MPTATFAAKGYTKLRDGKAEGNDMTLQAQKHIRLGGKENTEVGLIVRVGVAPQPGDRALDDLAENSITLTLSQAVLFASELLREVGQIQQVLDKRINKEK